ncbi:MAG: polysaccharide deacetylase family protein [Polyangiaceae bacterium]|nr:polysaccharide deacetylase family protein [Polyangiaceae bacterium]
MTGSRTAGAAAVLLLASCAPAAPTDVGAKQVVAPTVSSPARVIDPRCDGTAPRGAIEVAITVDDLPRHGKLPDGMTRTGIVETMTASFARHGVSGVYGFVNGARVETDDEKRALDVWVSSGHNVANHGFSHTSAEKLSTAAFFEEVDKNEPILDPLRKKTKGSLRVFRYPYLHQGKDTAARDANVAGLTERHYRIAEVTFDFSDWAYTDPYERCTRKSAQEEIRALEESYLEQAEAALAWSDAAACTLVGRPIRHILLLHISPFSALRMDTLLSRLEGLGARFISLEAALEDPVHASEPLEQRSVRGPLLYQIRAAKKAKYVPIPAVPDPALAVVCK